MGWVELPWSKPQGQVHFSEARPLKEVLVFALKDISALTPFPDGK
jgi:hypothetical protein